MADRKVITVFGSSAIQPGDPDYEKAERLGRALAQAGYTVCNGGYMGSMEASAKGANEAGGKVIGVTCDAFSIRTPCPYLTEERREPTLLRRIDTLIHSADAYVVLPGGIGTLAELFVVWNLLAVDCLSPRPFLLYGEHYQELLRCFERLAEIGPRQTKYLKVIEDQEALLEELRKSL